ncbi:NAD(P)-dependent oxidoreductase [Saccharothrix hoggarensis]|uniref:NAD(P)-dependent oxidoreductase n=1 Tax=Saccharothrix hoggarensis TaxID=913853 RepID=A0ABW3QSR9_9PSEU
MQVLVSNEPDDEVGVEKLSDLNGVEVCTYDPNVSVLTDTQRMSEILLPPYRGSHRPIPLVEQLPNLGMVQLLSAGVDEWAEHVPDSVVLSSARGAHAGPVSEWVLSAILTQYRQWPALVRFQDSRVWAHRRFNADTLDGKRVLIVGAGSIGRAVARRLTAFDVSCTLVASAPRDGVHGADEIPDLVPGHHIVVIAAPLTEKTRGLVNAEFLATMSDGALLVNAARGKIVDTMALVGELESGRLRAALDVTEPEPLPKDHPLWSCPGVIVSPHSARTVPGVNLLCYEVAAARIAGFINLGTVARQSEKGAL